MAASRSRCSTTLGASPSSFRFALGASGAYRVLLDAFGMSVDTGALISRPSAVLDKLAL